jgi:glucose/arabinose dehydrogenase
MTMSPVVRLTGLRHACSIVRLWGMVAACLMVHQPAEAQSGAKPLRFAWDQAARGATELGAYRYTIYVDGTASPLEGWSCSPTAVSTTFQCVASLPPLAPGPHTIELVTSVSIAGRIERSGRSTPLLVSIPPAHQTATADARGAREFAAEVVTSDNVRLTVETVTSGLNDPVDLAFGLDGTVFVAERGGTVRVVENGRLARDAALRLEDLSTPHRSAGLLGIAVDAEFPRNRLVYVVYVAASETGALVYRVARFRYVGGVLGERAVLLDAVAASEDNLAASLRVGPDGKLYAAFGDVADVRRHDASAYNGKLLRLNRDGATPSDQPGATPVHVSGLTSPRGFGWDEDERLWIADATPDGTTHVRHFAAGTRPSTASTHVLAPQPVVASISRYDHPLMPTFRGDFLAGAFQSGQILRVRLDAASAAPTAAERLLQDHDTPVRVVAVDPRGEIYFCTSTALGRMIPN